MFRHILPAVILLAGCTTPPVAPEMLGATGAQTAKVPTLARSLPYTVLAECMGNEQPQATVAQFHAGQDLLTAWNSLATYGQPEAIGTGNLAKVDFARQSAYLIGIPYPYQTDQPVISSIDEQARTVEVRYWTTVPGSVRLPATKTHYLAVAFQSTTKPVKLVDLGAKPVTP